MLASRHLLPWTVCPVLSASINFSLGTGIWISKAAELVCWNENHNALCHSTSGCTPSSLSDSAFFHGFCRSWRSRTSSHLLVPSLPHAAPVSIGPQSRLSFQSSACGRLSIRLAGLAQVKPTFAPASFRPMAAFSSRAAKSLNGGAACRATDRNGNFLEQGREFEGVSSVAPRSVEFLKSTVSHGSNFVRDNVGSIDVIVGPMFAGKTTALLQRVRKEVDAGRYSQSSFKRRSSSELLPISSSADTDAGLGSCHVDYLIHFCFSF